MVNGSVMGDILEGLFEASSAELFPVLAPRTWDPLTEEQTAFLESNGNRSPDWTGVRVAPGSDLRTVEDCRFEGTVRLSLLPAPGGSANTAPLLRDSLLANTEVGPGCRVVSVGEVRGCILESAVILENCGRITYTRGTCCGCGTDIELGVETGERTAGSFTHMNASLAGILSGRTDPELSQRYMKSLAGLLERLAARPMGLIRSGSVIRGTSSVENCFIGGRCLIDDAVTVGNSTLLGGPEEGSSVTGGALVRNSVLQWGAVVDSMAIVEDSLVGECSRVERHGKLLRSFLGPDSVLGEGEISSSLAGPFTSAHHQSLLIAARWPGGRGNIAYGANVGSNHTSRLPDQEVWPGEGMFFGLGCSVKFPADYSAAPYTVIATGVTTLPQKVEMPFSLISEAFSRGGGDIPPAYNQIVPAWVLSDNLFSVLRNRSKYRSRGRARRWKVPADIFSPDILGMMVHARDTLAGAPSRSIHTGADIPGLGKNFMTEEHRVRGIETYSFHLGFRALERMFCRIMDGAPASSVLSADTDDPAWGIHRSIIGSQYPGMAVSELLSELGGMWDRILKDARRSRLKDFQRGERIIPGYADVHGLIDDDPFLGELQTEHGEVMQKLEGLMESMPD